MKICIIGGGFTGVACATELALSAQHSVTLLEKSDRLGGLAGGFREPEWLWGVENFYHHWFLSDIFVQEFLSKWGIRDHLIFKKVLSALETKHQGLARLDSPISLLRYPEISFFNKVRMCFVLAFLKLVKNGLRFEKETAWQWCERWMGRAGFQELWQPLLCGKFGLENASQVNMAWFWARIFCRSARLGTYQGGFFALGNHVAQWLQDKGVAINFQVENITLARQEKKWLVSTKNFQESFDAIVIAAGPATFKNLCSAFAPRYIERFFFKAALGAVVVLFALKKSLSPYYWINLRKSDENSFLAIIEHTHLVDKKNYNGDTLVYVVDYCSPASAKWQKTQDELFVEGLGALQKINSCLEVADIRKFWVFREPYAQPLFPISASRDIPPVEVCECSGLYHGSMQHIYPWDRGTNFALNLGKSIAVKLMGEFGEQL